MEQQFINYVLKIIYNSRFFTDFDPYSVPYMLVIEGLQKESKIPIPKDTMPIRYYDFILKLSTALVLNRRFRKYKKFIMRKALKQKRLGGGITDCLVYYNLWSEICSYHRKIILQRKLLLRYPEQMFQILHN